MANHIVRTEQLSSGILQITLSRPEALNALNTELMEALLQHLVAAKDNAAVKAILLTGENKAFCAGADIHQLEKLDAHSGEAFARRGQALFRYLEQLGKPSLAAINGFAMGGGCELAMAATMRIAVAHAQFAQPEVKLGVIPGFGGTQRLARLVGKGRALELCLTARTLKAEEALQWGLISEITTAENLLLRAREILEKLCQLAPLALKSVMTVVDHGFDLPLDDALAFEALHFGLCCGTHDKNIGVKAFLEKRAAVFEGS